MSTQAILLDALRSARAFVAEELEQRKSSFLPTPTDGEVGYIEEAQAVLDEIEGALYFEEMQS